MRFKDADILIMARKQTPELIDLPEDSLEGIKSRITTGTLLEEDKKIIVVILTTYVWLLRQLQFTKISIIRLKNLFGFNTEKRKNKKKQQDSLTSTGALPDLNELQENQPRSLNEMQGLEQESAEKK
jgi:hypothetical protein